jgi:hypothetical protein
VSNLYYFKGRFGLSGSKIGDTFDSLQVIEARRADDDFIEVHILDSGPGFSRDRIEMTLDHVRRVEGGDPVLATFTTAWRGKAESTGRGSDA